MDHEITFRNTRKYVEELQCVEKLTADLVKATETFRKQVARISDKHGIQVQVDPIFEILNEKEENHGS